MNEHIRVQAFCIDNNNDNNNEDGDNNNTDNKNSKKIITVGPNNKMPELDEI